MRNRNLIYLSIRGVSAMAVESFFGLSGQNSGISRLGYYGNIG
ncbi:hypothetical protein J2S19_003933 [Metabacillus malikii]|uniref:Uncharacterized protein n=1 Tax=Metabacillus malikii TaxID=1504265 RepID=A0ABT9ZLE6_9BACI|nr:hypothetical protein [Metabacillus malikii]